MKKIIIIVIALIVIGGVFGVMVALKSTDGPKDAANEFLELARDGRIQEAFDLYASESVKEKISFTNFEQTLAPFKNYDDLSWSAVSVSGDAADLEGVVTFADNIDFSLTMSFSRESEQWKVKAFNYKVKLSTPNSLPSESELTKLVNDSMRLFVDAVNEDDYDDFYDEIASLWKNQITADQLKESFKQFVPLKDEIVFIKSSEPVFTDDADIVDSILKVSGYYKSDDTTVAFELDYLTEGKNWKLIRINVKM
ncbi:MAG: hypothetical protein Q8Q37_00415 [bacterium]|nr:hypothetical protein [bacterium]